MPDVDQPRPQHLRGRGRASTPPAATSEATSLLATSSASCCRIPYDLDSQDLALQRARRESCFLRWADRRDRASRNRPQYPAVREPVPLRRAQAGPLDGRRRRRLRGCRSSTTPPTSMRRAAARLRRRQLARRDPELRLQLRRTGRSSKLGYGLTTTQIHEFGHHFGHEPPARRLRHREASTSAPPTASTSPGRATSRTRS